MTKRIATGPFVLTLATGDKKDYRAGEEISADHVDHWWAKAHSTEVDPKAEAAQLAREAAEADERKRLEDENSRLRADAERLRQEAEQHKADAERFRAESASTAPAATDAKKKKDDKDPSSK